MATDEDQEQSLEDDGAAEALERDESDEAFDEDGEASPEDVQSDDFIAPGPQSQLERRADHLAGRHASRSEVSADDPLEALRSQCVEAQRSFEESECEVAQLHKALDEAHRDLADARHEAEAARAEAPTGWLDSDAALALEKKAVEASELASSLSREVERRDVELRGASTRIARLENDLDLARMTPGERDHEMKGLRSALEQAQADASGCQREMAELKIELAMVRAESEGRGEELDTVSARLDASRADFVLREREIAALQEEKRGLVGRNRGLEARCTELRSELDTANERLAARDRELSAQAEHLSVTREGHLRRDAQIETLESSLQSSAEQSLMLEAEIAALRAEIEHDHRLVGERDQRIQALVETVAAVERAMVGHGGNLAAGSSPLPAQDPSPIPAPPAPHPPAGPAPAPDSESAQLPAAVGAWDDAEPLAADTAPATSLLEDEAADRLDEASETSTAGEPGSPDEGETNDSAPGSVDADTGPEAPLEATADDTPAAHASAVVEAAPIFAGPPRMPPPIYRFWRDRQIEKLLESLGVASFDELAAETIGRACDAFDDEVVHIWSICGGDPEVELRISGKLTEQGHDNFHFHCLEPVPANEKKRGTIATTLGLNDRVESVEADFSAWPADAPCSFILADNAISLAADPEALLARIGQACDADATLILCDRLRAPLDLSRESIGAVERVWAVMLDDYKMDHLADIEHTTFAEAHADADDPETLDLAVLLRNLYYPEVRACFGNLMDLFTGPRRGLNFNAKDEDSRRFIESFEDVDEARTREESLPPRHIVAVLRSEPVDDPLLVGLELD